MKRTILRRRAWRGAVASGMLLMSVPAWTAEKTADEDSLLPSEAESLIVTRVAEQVTLTFNSETGKIYSVIYADRISGRPNWKYVPGHENLPGRGQRVTLKLTQPPEEKRYYRLQARPARPRK